MGASDEKQSTIPLPVESNTPIISCATAATIRSGESAKSREEIVYPISPTRAIKLFMKELTDYEMGEILDYQQVYFLGLEAQKIKGSPAN